MYMDFSKLVEQNKSNKLEVRKAGSVARLLAELGMIGAIVYLVVS
jgi:hypothetical protein